jgi:hypothetical protein
VSVKELEKKLSKALGIEFVKEIKGSLINLEIRKNGKCVHKASYTVVGCLDFLCGMATALKLMEVDKHGASSGAGDRD